MLKSWLSLKKNPVDLLIEKFSILLKDNSKIRKGFEDPEKSKFLSFALRSLVELHNFRETHVGIYLVSAETFVKKMNHDVQRSKYRSLYQSENPFDDQFYELVRLGYVSLYHKFETFLNEVPSQVDNLSSSKYPDISVSNFLKTRLNFSIKDVKNYHPRIQKINWICNCAKHYDGFPLKKDPPEQFSNCHSSVRIRIEKQELQSDVEFLMDYYSHLISLFIFMGIMNTIFMNKEQTKFGSGEAVIDVEALALELSRAILVSMKDMNNDAMMAAGAKISASFT